MVGREVSFRVEKRLAHPKDVILSVNNLSMMNRDKTKHLLNKVSFEVRSGEIVCVAGIEGNGQTELVRLITGLSNIDNKESAIFLNGENIIHQSILHRFELGMSHIPEDRQRHGLILNYNLAENMISNQFYKKPFQNFGLLSRKEIYKYANELIIKHDIRSSLGAKSSARSMSGGNQQKAIIARETSRKHNLLIASQPTRGLDVGAIEFVHKTLIQERDKGNAILVISLELDEVMNISDRILVMHDGEIYAELNPKETSVEEIGLYMSGSKRQNPEVQDGQN